MAGMPNGSPRYYIDPKRRIVRAIDAFFRALLVPATAKDSGTWRDTAPTTVWNFDDHQPAAPQLTFFTEERKTKTFF